MKNLVAVIALVLIAGTVGWWLRGRVDPPATVVTPSETPPRTAEERRAVSPDPQAARKATKAPTDLWSALRSPKKERFARVVGSDAARAETVLPELLARARREMDVRKIRAVLELMIEAGSAELRAVVLAAMVSEEADFDFSHRGNRFRDMLSGVHSADVGEAALRRLRWEIGRGETSRIGGYAVLIGGSRLPAGTEFLQGLYQEGGRLRRVAVAGLAATGEDQVLSDLARGGDVREEHLKTFLARAGLGGWTTVERLATAPQTGRRIAASAAKLSAQQRRAETGALLEQLWRVGFERAAMEGCMTLRPDTVSKSSVDALTEIVFGVMLDKTKYTHVRRAAFYAVEYSKVFQTERARTLLADFVASRPDRYWERAARPALRETERALRRD